MLRHIIQFSVSNKLVVGLAVIALMAAGIFSLGRLPIDAVPDITNNQVMVITTNNRLGAADMERFITFPVEQATRNIPGLVEQRSFSRFGLSLVTLVFDDGTDVYWARQQVSERLQGLQQTLPPDLGVPYMGPVTTGLGEIYQYVLRPLPGHEAEFDTERLRTLQDWVVRRQLLGTEGVADVSSFGGHLRQVEIAVDPARLAAAGVSLRELMAAVEENNQNTGGSYIEKGPTVLFIRSEGLARDLEEIGAAPVKWMPNGQPLRVRDVAEVKLGHATRFGALTYNDQGEVAGGIVMMVKGGNSAQVIHQVKQRISEIQASLPKGVVIEPFLDRTKMVDSAVGTVERNLMEGALIVVFVLVIFLGNVRAGLLVASVIPLAMLFAVTLMVLFGVSGNLMSLGALDFGLIVDGAVIIVESVLHRLHHRPEWKGLRTVTRDQLGTEVREASSKMMGAAVFGQAIILIVYLPILSLQGIEGKMFRPMALTVAFALLGAFLLSLTYVPMMASLVLSKRLPTRPSLTDRAMKLVERLYEWSLRFALRLPVILVASCLLAFGGTVWMLTRLGGEFIPQLEEGDFAVETRVLTGSGLTTTVQATTQAAGILKRNFPEVEKVVAKIGSGEIPTDPMPIEAADMMVILKPQEEWVSAKTFPELADKMQQSLEVVPGLSVGFQYPVQMRFNELMTGAKQDVVCKIYGDNLDSLAAHATELGRIVSTVPGAQDLYVEAVTGLPEIVVTPNRAALAQHGVSIQAVNEALEASFSGAQVGTLYEEGRRVDIVVRMRQELRTRVEDVRALLVPTPAGSEVPLGNLAEVSIKVGPNQVQHENAQRRIMVGFNVRGRDVQSVVQEVQAKVKAQLVLPTGYSITYGGQFENLNAARNRLAIAVPVAMGLIFLLLYFAFGNLRHSLLVFSAIPLSAIGGVLALVTRGMPFSISAGVGFIALFGVAVLNGIVLLSEFRQRKASGEGEVLGTVVGGARSRIRPVLMTAAVASLGFLPMALSQSPGSEVQRPLATVVIGGLITSTLLTLIVLPVVYYYAEGGKRRSLKVPKAAKAVATLLLLGICTLPLAGQQISLQAAVDSALRHNLTVGMADAHAALLQARERTAVSLPPTELTGEFGQVNTMAMDNKLSLQQGFALPSVYAATRSLRRAETAQGRQLLALTQREVQREVTLSYYEMLWLIEKRSLLLRADSLFAAYATRQAERLSAGDANLLEQLAADARRAEVAQQLGILETDLANEQRHFALLLHSTTSWMPAPAQLRYQPPGPVLEETSLPTLQWARAGVEVARTQRLLDRRQMLPTFSLGVTSQTFVGWQNVQGQDQYFGPSRRFSVVNVGMSAPLLFRHDAARSEAARLQLTLAQTQAARLQEQAQWQADALRQTLKAQDNILQWHTAQGLAKATQISSLADEQLSQGDINFLDWMMLQNQSIQMQRNYLDALHEWNAASIQLQFLNPLAQ